MFRRDELLLSGAVKLNLKQTTSLTPGGPNDSPIQMMEVRKKHYWMRDSGAVAPSVGSVNACCLISTEIWKVTYNAKVWCMVKFSCLFSLVIRKCNILQTNFSNKSSIVFSSPSVITHRQAADSTTQLGPHYTPSSGQEGYRSIRDVLPHTATQWVVIDACVWQTVCEDLLFSLWARGEMEQNKTSSDAAHYVNASFFFFYISCLTSWTQTAH